MPSIGKVSLEQSSSGLWVGRVVEGWSVEYEVHGHEREVVLIELLRLMGYDIVIKPWSYIEFDRGSR